MKFYYKYLEIDLNFIDSIHGYQLLQSFRIFLNENPNPNNRHHTKFL